MRSTLGPRCVAIVCLSAFGCGAAAPPRPMQLRRVTLYQNGIGYFERTGHVAGGALALAFARPELDDVLKTLTVIDRLGGAVATVDVPTTEAKAKTVAIRVRLAATRIHDLLVGYAVPTPTWKAAYRVVLDAKSPSALLQGWAMVSNRSQEDWRGVELTLATGAPMSFAQDLATPQYVRRPDVTGRLVAPTVLGPVTGETSSAGDRDADGILDAEDRCPDEPEDADAFADADGCPDPDNDRDGIADADDLCPDDGETHNGGDDLDGCPDRGRVVVTSSAFTVLDRIVFAAGSDALAPASAQLLDAIAATLRAHPEIVLVELGGHTAADEPEPWGLAARRAEAVRAALVARGVARPRLEITPYGATSPLDTQETPAGRARNRRVELLILKRAEDTPPRRPSTTPRLDAAAMQASAQPRTRPASVAGAVRYTLTEPVSIPRGASSMVSILNAQIRGEDVFLFRPDANAPGSDRHPFRAARLENSSGYTLEPGPIAIFAGGTFVGDSLLSRLHVGETAWIPYAVAGGTVVAVVTADAERPVRLVALRRGVLTVENAGVRTTRYAIAPGPHPARTIYLRHAKAAGYDARDLPPEAVDQGDAYLIPLPLVPGRQSTLTVEERQPRRQSVGLLDAGRTELGVYLEGTDLPPALAERVQAALRLRTELGTLDDELATLRERIADTAARGRELRASLATLDKVRGADALRKQLVASLAETAAAADAHARLLARKLEAHAAKRNTLQIALRELTLEEAP